MGHSSYKGRVRASGGFLARGHSRKASRNPVIKHVGVTYLIESVTLTQTPLHLR